MREFATTLGYGMGNSVVESRDLKVGGLRRDRGIRWDRLQGKTATAAPVSVLLHFMLSGGSEIAKVLFCS